MAGRREGSMGAWKRCSECRGKVRVLIVMNEGRVDTSREAWSCLNPRCQHVEVVLKGAATAQQRT